jgi:hypothetical protein
MEVVINEAGGAGEVGVGVGPVRVGGVGGVEDGIVSLEPNDDFAIGAPHVRQAAYKPRVTFHPASVELGGQGIGIGSGDGKRKEKERERERKSEKGEKEKGWRRIGRR